MTSDQEQVDAFFVSSNTPKNLKDQQSPAKLVSKKTSLETEKENIEEKSESVTLVSSPKLLMPAAPKLR